jgi:hypothetical protein
MNKSNDETEAEINAKVAPHLGMKSQTSKTRTKPAVLDLD